MPEMQDATDHLCPHEENRIFGNIWQVDEDTEKPSRLLGRNDTEGWIPAELRPTGAPFPLHITISISPDVGLYCVPISGWQTTRQQDVQACTAAHLVHPALDTSRCSCI